MLFSVEPVLHPTAGDSGVDRTGQGQVLQEPSVSMPAGGEEELGRVGALPLRQPCLPVPHPFSGDGQDHHGLVAANSAFVDSVQHGDRCLDDVAHDPALSGNESVGVGGVERVSRVAHGGAGEESARLELPAPGDLEGGSRVELGLNQQQLELELEHGQGQGQVLEGGSRAELALINRNHQTRLEQGLDQGQVQLLPFDAHQPGGGVSRQDGLHPSQPQALP